VYNSWHGDGAGNAVEDSSIFSVIQMHKLQSAVIPYASTWYDQPIYQIWSL